MADEHKTLLQYFREYCGGKSDSASVAEAYATLNAQAVAQAASGDDFSEEECIELFLDFTKRFMDKDEIYDVFMERWQGLPVVLGAGQRYLEEREMRKAHELIEELNGTQQRQVLTFADYLTSIPELHNVTFHFGNANELREIMFSQDADKETRNWKRGLLIAYAVRLLTEGGAAVARISKAEEDALYAFAGHGKQIFRLSGTYMNSSLQVGEGEDRYYTADADLPFPK